MYPPDKENRIAPENYSTAAQMPFDARRGVVSHPVLEWAEAILHGSESVPRLRNKVLTVFKDLPNIVTNLGVYGGIKVNSLTSDWTVIEPALTKFIPKAILLPDGIDKRELLGLAEIIHKNTRFDKEKADVLTPMGVNLDLEAYSARLLLAEDFGDKDDWLAALANMVWVNGKQMEAEFKEQARAEGVRYLSRLQRINIEDLEEVYRAVLTKVRPKATKVIFVRERKANYDDYGGYIADGTIRHLAINHSAGERVIAVKDYLRNYNAALETAKGIIAENIAWLSVAYICIHPHVDYNGTMARILVDNYLVRKGFKPIKWDRIKIDPAVSKEFASANGEYTYYGKTQALVDWFGRQLGDAENVLT